MMVHELREQLRALGADIVFLQEVQGMHERHAEAIANWPETRHAHWRTLLQARAIENQAWVVGVNRCGRDPKFVYAGGTMIVDPMGRIVAEAGDAEAVLVAEADPEVALQFRSSFPVLDDLRPEWTRG